MTELINGHGANGVNGHHASAPPDIPHITNNIVPLTNILKFYAAEAYKQLSTAIESLAGSRDSDPDLLRKKQFLHQIISIRQHFVKLYALVKWSANARDISKLIDLLNWFRMQDFHFDQLAFQTNSLNSFGGAKLPNSDLETALEVMLEGRPQLPSYNYIKTPAVSPAKVLEVLRDLNLVLTTRMALLQAIPPRFLHHYQVADGRIYFTIPNEFQVAVTVANDVILASDDDYAKSPFYFVDFKFLFGLNPDTSLITHRDNHIVTRLPRPSHEKLEKVANAVLLAQGLPGLYDLLHKYSISFKLYLIAKQLRELSIHSKWRGNIQFNYQYGGALIIINYWCAAPLSRQWRSFIELGIDRHYNLNFRWFKNGGYVLDHGIDGIFSSNLARSASASPDDDLDEVGDISVDLILNIVANRHAEVLMSAIYDALVARVGTGQFSWVSPHQLQVQLSPNKSAVFAINPLTGTFYFVDPTPIQDAAAARINTVPAAAAKRFVSEAELVSTTVAALVQLRLDTFNAEINTKLVTTGWIGNEIIKLSDPEHARLTQGLAVPKRTLTRFYRRKNWPSSWFLVSLLSGTHSQTYWWVARIKSIKGEWKIQWKDALRSEDGGVESYRLVYSWFAEIGAVCINTIIDHMLLEELRSRQISFVTGPRAGSLMQKYGVADARGDAPYESVVVIYNPDTLLSLSVSINCLFLSVKLVSAAGGTHMHLKLTGVLNRPLNIAADNSLNLTADADAGVFAIAEVINLTTSIASDSSVPTRPLLEPIFNNLNKLNQVITILNQLDSNHITVESNSLDLITIRFDARVPHRVQIAIAARASDPIQLKDGGCDAGATPDHELPIVLAYLNRRLAAGEPINGIIRYLREVAPILAAVRRVRSEMTSTAVGQLANRMPRLVFDVKIPTLDLIQFVFQLNYLSPQRKLTKDKITINLSFKTNKFAKKASNSVKISLKDNINPENLKYKPLFEKIFKAINDGDKADGSAKLVKLNCDFLVDPSITDELMSSIAGCFLSYLRTSESN
ncbi:mediator of RNA polymerase II transcription subunit 14 [Diutina catenulata]